MGLCLILLLVSIAYNLQSMKLKFNVQKYIIT